MDPEIARLHDAAWLRDAYVTRGRAMNDIAKELGCTRPAVSKALRRLGIPSRRAGTRTGSAAIHEGYVYVIQAGGKDGPVKIGWSTESPAWRRDVLQIGNHLELKILTTISAKRSLERELHAELKAHRIRGEWFTFNEAVRAAITRILMEPGRINRAAGKNWRYQCDQCGVVGSVSEGQRLCAVCEEFAEAREAASRGIDPFAAAA